MNYLLYGELYPMIRKRVNKILTEKLGEVDDFNVVRLDYEESSIDEIALETSALPLGYEKKAVIVDNATFLKKDATEDEKTRILEILKENNDDFIIIFILRDNSVDTKSAIFEYLNENGKIDFFKTIEKDEWPVFVRKYFVSKNVEIEPAAVGELVQRVDGDLTRFINEADKLMLHKSPITLSDVLLLVSKPLENDAFQMSNALFKGDNALALSIYRDLKLQGIKFVDALIPMLASQFRFISEVCFLENRGLGKEEIASQLDVKPFRVQMALKNSRYLSRRKIAEVLDRLYNLDYQIKSGQIDRSYGLELFLINFPD